MPKLNEIKLHREPVDNRLRHRQGLGNLQDPATIEAIGNRATDCANQETRKGIEKCDHTKSDRRTRQLPDQPALSDVLHKIARARYQSTFHEQTEVAMSERSQGSKIPKALHGNCTGKKFYQFDPFADVMQRLGSNSSFTAI